MKLFQVLVLISLLSSTFSDIFTPINDAPINNLSDHFVCKSDSNMTVCEKIKNITVASREMKCSEENIFVNVALGKEKTIGEVFMKPYSTENEFVAKQTYSDCKLLRKYFINRDKVLIRIGKTFELKDISEADFWVFKQLLSNLSIYTAFAYYFGWYCDEKNVYYILKPLQVILTIKLKLVDMH